MAILLWQVLYWGPLADSPLPAPIEVAEASVTLLGSAEFWTALVVLLKMAVIGFAAATVAGVVLGLLFGWYPTLGRTMSPIVEFLKPIPPIVILPLAILVLGPTEKMGIFLVFYGCLLPILYQTQNGVSETDPVTIQTSRSYGVPRIQILWGVVLPSTSAFIATALRIAIPISLIVSVVSGLVGGAPGLGQLIRKMSMSSSNAPSLYALVILLGLIGLLAQFATEWAEQRLLFWHPSYRKEAR